jgi:hypothetical protein
VDIDLNVEILIPQISISNYPAESVSQKREMNVFLAVIGRSLGVTALQYKNAFALVLTPVLGARNRYERVGIVELDPAEPDLLAADISPIEIL